MMRKYALVVPALMMALVPAPVPAEVLQLECDTAVEVLFVPGDQVTTRVVEMLGQARSEVLVQAYSFTSKPIAQALLAAHRRGVAVRVIVDGQQSRGKGAQGGMLAAPGVPVFVDRAHRIAHNKVMVIDRRTVLTGSFNWTASAQHTNAENLESWISPVMAASFLANWKRHLEHSQPWGADLD